MLERVAEPLLRARTALRAEYATLHRELLRTVREDEVNLKLDQGLAEFARRRLDEACPDLILDARYERVREAGVIRSQAVLLAIGIGGTAGAAFWRWSSPTARAARAGATSCYSCASAACQASSWWSRTTMPGSDRRSSRSCRKPRGSAVTYVHFPAQRARLRAAQDRRRLPARAPLALRPARPHGGRARSRGLARQVAGDLPQALRLGRRAHRGDADLLSATAPAPQAPQVDG